MHRDVKPEPRVSRKVTLKLKERERGLAGVCAGPRGYDVRVDGRRVGAVYAMGGGWRGEVSGWYFAIVDDKLGIPLRNTCGEVGVPLEDVKKSAIAYVKQCLASKAGGAKCAGVPRCSVCGCRRIVKEDGRVGACSLVPGGDGKGGCPDPLRDCNRERATKAGGAK